MGPVQWTAILVIILAVVAIARGWEVRLTLLAGALVLAALVNDVPFVIRVFLETFSNEKFVVPICTAMGFAYVLRHTGCDQHLVRLLTAPLRYVAFLLVPGVILVGFIVNIPVISQTSTAVCLGPVVVPLLRAAGYRSATIAACLCLGASVGGELLNPGAPELRTIRDRTGIETRELAWTYILPLLLPYVVTAGLVFWLQSMWDERRARRREAAGEGAGIASETTGPTPPAVIDRINPLKAMVPLVPLVLLFVTGPPLNLVDVPEKWVTTKEGTFDSRLIGAAMLVGVAVAALVIPNKARDCPRIFFDGAGYGFANIVSLIVTANCFGQAIARVGLADALGSVMAGAPELLIPLAAILPWSFAVICGSGMATTQSLYAFFYDPAVSLGQDPAEVGAVVSIASAAGRTMSPAAAVVLMSATLTGTKPFAIVARLLAPLVIGLIVTVALRMLGVI